MDNQDDHNQSNDLIERIFQSEPLLKSFKSICKDNKSAVHELSPEQRARNLVNQVMEAGRTKPDQK